MKKTIRFGVCGGDLRQKYLTESLFEDGFPIAVWDGGGLPVRPDIPRYSWDALIAWCDVFLLPVPATKDGKTVYAPYADLPLPLKGDLPKALRGKTVLGGMLNNLPETDPLWKKTDLRDYAASEGFAVRNAVATAEGALALLITHSQETLHGSPCLITGFGRIGRVLAADLLTLGADVTVAARSEAALAWAESMGCRIVPLSVLEADTARNRTYAFVLNTIPAPVLSVPFLQTLSPDCVLLELASAPYGFDREAASALGKTVVSAAGLPGRFSPKSAGEICKKAILSRLEE